MISVNDLKPCPFCAGVGMPAHIVAANDEKHYFVRCRSCACEGPWTKNEHGARRMWNLRDGVWPEPEPDQPAGESIDILELSVRAYKTLFNHGIRTVPQLLKLSRHDLSLYKGCGNILILQIEEALEKLGLRLRYAQPTKPVKVAKP